MEKKTKQEEYKILQKLESLTLPIFDRIGHRKFNNYLNLSNMIFEFKSVINKSTNKKLVEDIYDNIKKLEVNGMECIEIKDKLLQVLTIYSKNIANLSIPSGQDSIILNRKTIEDALDVSIKFIEILIIKKETELEFKIKEDKKMKGIHTINNFSIDDSILQKAGLKIYDLLL